MREFMMIDYDSAAGWYDRNADKFAAGAACIDTSAIIAPFMAIIPPGGRVLDAGCGSGRDCLTFLDSGFEVSAFDASLAMCEMTEKVTRGRVKPRHMRLQDFEDEPGSWDGIWAMASLLHVSPEDFNNVVRALTRSLTENGSLYLCTKSGADERFDAVGRPFSDMTMDQMRERLRDLGEGTVWETSSAASGGETQVWVNAIIRRLPEPGLQPF